MSRVDVSVHLADKVEGAVRRTAWLEVGSRLDAKFGGISASIPRLCEATNAVGSQVTSIVGFCEPDEDTHHLESEGIPFTRFPLGRMRWRSHPSLRRRLATLLRSSDGLHIHGIWDEHCAISGSLARAAGKPYIVSAHGMLERWAVKHKGLKKAIYSVLIERSNLRQAACLRALTQAEVGDYRRYGLNAPVAVIPNGVEVPQNASPEPFFRVYPQLEGKRLVLFLGRMHYKKGLDILCRAWRNVRDHFPNAHLVLAGSDFDNTTACMHTLVDELGIAASVTFAGMLRGGLKWNALAAAEVFVLPSYSEGFSVAVLEAMGMGIPVIISKPCNFPEVAAEGCGHVIDPDAVQLEAALSDLLGSGTSRLARMGEKGRQLVAARYTWPAVGRQMAQVYDWVLGGPSPSLVPIF